MGAPVLISSRDNRRLVEVRRLLRDAAAYRKSGRSWLEGDHLLRAWLARGHPLGEVIFAETAWSRPALAALAQHAERILLVPDALFDELSLLPSPARVGALVPVPPAAAIGCDAPTLVLDRVQDAGNVGSMLRSAAAMGMTQVLALQGTAALWSQKVLRAGMGAHFGLHLHESLAQDSLRLLHCPLVAASSHATASLHRTRLPWPCAWVFGHEGQGVDAALLQHCALQVRIDQPGGEESLNVAAAAAICLYESARQQAARAAPRQ